MKRWMGLLSLAAAFALVVGTIAVAAEEKKAEEKKVEEKAKAVTMTGEVVDTGCWLAHEAKGAKHKECAVTCVAAGMPIGLLTEKDALYLLVPPHDNKDGYNKAKELVGEKVEVSGMPFVRGGMRAIEVASAKPAPAPAAAPAK